MQDIVWLAGGVIAVIALWLVWRLSRDASKNADPPVRLERPRAHANQWAAKPAEPVADAPAHEIVLPAAVGDPDDLSKIKGVGPKLISRLGELGVTRYDQIAAWTPEQMTALDAQLGAFAGRPARDNWVEQAELLAKGDTAAFEAKFGKLGG